MHSLNTLSWWCWWLWLNAKSISDRHGNCSIFIVPLAMIGIKMHSPLEWPLHPEYVDCLLNILFFTLVHIFRLFLMFSFSFQTSPSWQLATWKAVESLNFKVVSSFSRAWEQFLQQDAEVEFAVDILIKKCLKPLSCLGTISTTRCWGWICCWYPDKEMSQASLVLGDNFYKKMLRTNLLKLCCLKDITPSSASASK